MRRFEEQYRLNEGDDVLVRENAIHQDVDLRLDDVEQGVAAYRAGQRDDIEAILASLEQTFGQLAAEMRGLLDQASGGLSADIIVETATRTFWTAAKAAALKAELLGGVPGAGDTLAKLYDLIASRADAAAVAAAIAGIRGTADAAHDTLGEIQVLLDAAVAGVASNASAIAAANASITAVNAQLAAGVPTMDAFLATAVEIAQLKFGALTLPDGFVDDFDRPDFIDPASTGYFVDTTNGGVIGGVGGPTLFADGTPAFESHTSLPPMTSNAAAVGATGHTASASSESQAAYAAWKAQVNTVSGNATVWQASSTAMPQWIARGVPAAIRCGAYTWSESWDGTYYNSPTAWQLHGSNDPGFATFDVLDTRSGFSVPARGARCSFVIPVANRGSYKYHRLYVTAYTNNSGSPLTLADFSLLQVITGIEGQTSIPFHTGANTVVGNANGYSVGASVAITAGYEPYRACDGAKPASAAANQTWSTPNAGLASWQRGFPAPIRVLAYRIASCTPAYTPNGWQLQGSNTNNGTDWVTLDARAVPSNFWPSTYGDWTYFLVQTPGSYSYYRINFTTAAANGYCVIGEVEFLQGTSGDMDLKSLVYTRNAGVPSKASITLDFTVNAGTLNLNTNLKAQVSRNGGGSYKSVTLSLVGPVNASGRVRYRSPPTDLGDQPSDNKLKSRVLLTSGMGITLKALICLGAS